MFKRNKQYESRSLIVSNISVVFEYVRKYRLIQKKLFNIDHNKNSFAAGRVSEISRVTFTFLNCVNFIFFFYIYMSMYLCQKINEIDSSTKD